MGCVINNFSMDNMTMIIRVIKLVQNKILNKIY